MNAPKISAIIPLYNAEKYIRECLISVLSSKFTDYEVLVVDDCSTDKSVEEVKKLLPHFGGRLQILSTEKNSGGPGIPRNIGIKNAAGKYVTFIDNDDMILPTALGDFFKLAEYYNADIIHTEKCFSFSGEFNKKKLNICLLNKVEDWVDKPTLEPFDIGARVRNFTCKGLSVVPWSKLYRRDFILANKIEFPQMQYGEDYVFIFKCFCLAERYFFVPNITNIHRQRISSAGHVNVGTFQEGAQLALNILLKKVSILDKFMTELEFFKKNPECQCDVLKYCMGGEFRIVKSFFRNVKPHVLQKILLDEWQKPEYDIHGKDIVVTYLLAERLSDI